MSRSIGDNSAKKIGVIPDPEVFEMDFCKEDKFIVIGSDGIFDFLSNKQVIKFMSIFNNFERLLILFHLII